MFKAQLVVAFVLIAPPALAAELVPSAQTETPPIEFEAAYTGEAWRAARGGVQRGSRYLDNLDLTLTMDAERVVGWPGATVLVSGLYNNGASLSGDLIGDAQGVSNIETGERAFRLFEAWVEQRLASDQVSLKAGLYDLNSEFDTTEAGGLFINPSHGIGPDFAQSGRNGPSIFPVTSLALRAEARLSENWLVRAAVLDAVPGDPDRPKRTAVRLSEDEGALLVAELNHLGENTKIGAGYWRYTAEFQPLAFDPANDGAPEATGNDGAYFLAERRLTRESDDDQGLSAFVRLGIADERFNPIRRYVGGGLVYAGPFRGRDQDKLGLALAAVEFGTPYRAGQGDVGAPLERREVNLELTYQAPITSWLTLQPDLQLILDPGGDPELRNAVVFGLRFEVAR